MGTENLRAVGTAADHPVVALQLLAWPLVAHELTRPLASLVGLQTWREAVTDHVVEFWLRAMATEASGS
jgi:hypothetical protein